MLEKKLRSETEMRIELIRRHRWIPASSDRWVQTRFFSSLNWSLVLLTGIDSDSSRLILTCEKSTTVKHHLKKCWHPLQIIWMSSTHRGLDFLELIIHDVIDQPRAYFDRFSLPSSNSISPTDLFASIEGGWSVDQSISSIVMRKWVVVHCRGRATRSTDESNFEVHWWKEKERNGGSRFVSRSSIIHAANRIEILSRTDLLLRSSCLVHRRESLDSSWIWLHRNA